MKKISFFLFTFFVTVTIFSQTQGVAYPSVGKGVATTFLTDYHCLGINSSALGWGTGFEEKKFTLGSSEFGFGMYSDALNSTKLKSLSTAIQNKITGNAPTNISFENQKLAAGEYAQTGVSVFLDYNWAGFSFQNKKFGGIAFNIHENYSYYSKFNKEVTDLIFRGSASSFFDSLTVVFGADTTVIANRPDISPDSLNNVVLGSIAIPLNLSQLTLGSEVKMVWNRSYNFGYGRKIIGKEGTFELFGGIGGRFIQSMAMFNLESKGNGLIMYSAITPSFNIDYGNIAATNPSNFNPGKSILPKAVGNGYGIDLSASVILFKNLKIAMAVNNIGQVTYNRNVYSVKDTLFTSLSLNGLVDYDITQSINQLLANGGILTLQGQDEYVLKNASDFRFGASFQPFKILHFGFDVVAPFNSNNPGSLQNPVYSFGGEIKPIKWISLSFGYFGGGIYQSNIPVGVNFILRDGSYEFGVSSRDAMNLFTKNTHSISSAFGFARFRF